jgi:UrcA family protein
VALGAPAIGSAAFEGNIAEESDINVNYNDLDLSEDKGVNALYQRLQWAATRVCGSTSVSELGSIEEASENRQCYRNVLNSAVAEIGNDRLSQIHSG